ncbi:histidine ammonia-lyase [Rhodoligotrophos appendicifer]|uniref:histidine ammonia-lyase n=1 Tax=Rhodoligotrophos appendicifer TaxID=987056 RepID=UPI00117D4C2E|nr:histidine ammonia-lyase [Rhodoligotrophos appendicifer]
MAAPVPVTIDPGGLTLSMLRSVSREPVRVTISASARENIVRSHGHLRRAMDSGDLIYGVNTGFGPLSKQAIPVRDLAELQRRLILSNAAGVGEPLAPGIVRRIVLLKLATLARGASGVSPDLADALAALLNRNVIPIIPEKGSVGASGDLAPLAHVGACLIGAGEAFHDGKRKPAAQALSDAGLQPYALQPKEGLALVNGTQVSTALAVEGLFLIEDLFSAALTIGALSVDAGSGTVHAFDRRLQDLRGQHGQKIVASHLRRTLEGSGLQANRPIVRVQDPYCLRCQPQVMGAVLDQVLHARTILARELNAVSDNPLFDPESGDILYGGNFHAQPIGLVADILALALAEIGSMSERRTAFLVDEKMSGLPAFLVEAGGLNSGFMVAQVTAAALASENKSLAHPNSIDSLPTAANQEDYVSMATHAARRLIPMADNAASILAIEFLSAAQGLDLRRPLRSSSALEAFVAELRQAVPTWLDDRYFAPDIEAARALVRGSLAADQSFLPA